MATAIYVKEDTLREYVAHLKEMVERGEIEVGKTVFSIATIPGKHQPLRQVGPENISDPVRSLCRVLMEHAGFISRVGNILKGTGILNNSFTNYDTEQIVELGMAAADATKGNRAKLAKKAKSYANWEPPSPLDDEDKSTIAVPVYDLINVLDRAELIYLRNAINDKLDYLPEELANKLKETEAELERRNKDNETVRAELRDTKVQLTNSREALGHAKTYIQPRVVERFVHIPNKPPETGQQGGGAGGFMKSTVVVHRKPLMGHTPKVVRDVKEEK